MADFEQLRDLIQAMTAQEQNYFRRHASQHVLKGRNRYLGLFEALAAQRDPEEAYSRSFVHYLQSTVLRALRQYHHQASAGMALRATLDELEIVFEKGQLKLADRLLQHGLRLADEVGEPWATMALLKWRRRLLRKATAPLRSFQAIEGQEAEAMQRCQQEVAAVQYHDRLFATARTGEAAPPVAGEIDAGDGQASFDAAIALATGRGIAAKRRGDPEAELAHFRENLEIWYRFPRRIADHPRRFTAALINYLRAGLGRNNFEGFAEVLARIQGLDFLHASHRAEIQLKCLSLQLVQHLNALDLQAAAPVAATLIAMSQAGRKSPLSPGMAYNVGVYGFLSGDAKTARRYLGRLTQARRDAGEPGARDAALLLDVLMAIDAGDDELAAARVRSRLRVRGRVALPDWQVTLYQHLAALLKPLHRRHRLQRLQHAAVHLAQAQGSKGEGYQEALLWLKARGQGLPVGASLGGPQD